MVKRNCFLSIVCLTIVAFFSFFPPSTQAEEIPGFLYVTKDYGPGLNENLRMTRLLFTTQNIRITIIVDDNPITYLYDLKTPQELLVLNVLDQTYQRMRASDVSVYAAEIEETIQARKTALKQQKDRLEAAAKANKIPTDSVSEIPVFLDDIVTPPLRWVDGDVKVHRWTCTKYISTRGEDTLEELYTTPWFMVGLQPENFGIFDTLKNNFSALFKYLGTSVVPGLGNRPVWKEDNVKGVPIQYVRLKNNKPIRTMKVLRVQRFLFPENSFTLPEGYRQAQPEKKPAE